MTAVFHVDPFYPDLGKVNEVGQISEVGCLLSS